MHLTDTPSWSRSALNLNRECAFVKISPNCSLVLQYSNSISLLPITSRRKWYLIDACLVLLLNIRFSFIVILDLLSHNIVVDPYWHSLISFSILLSHIAWLVAPTAITYSASSYDFATNSCFLDVQENISDSSENI